MHAVSSSKFLIVCGVTGDPTVRELAIPAPTLHVEPGRKSSTLDLESGVARSGEMAFTSPSKPTLECFGQEVDINMSKLKEVALP